LVARTAGSVIARQEWRWAAAMAVAVMAFTTAPYLAAAARQGADWRFSGALLAVEDGNSYIADMRQGAEGAWLFTLPYTSERHRPVLFFGLYLLLGKLAGSGHGALLVVFHAARILAGVGLLLASYRFLAMFLPTVQQRRLGLLLVALGGGLGWLLTLLPAPLFGSLPVDFISPEAFSFLVLFGLPHLALARALLLLGFLAYLRNKGLLAGLAWLGVGLLQPLYVAAAWLIVAADIGTSFLAGRQAQAAVLSITLSPPRPHTLSGETRSRILTALQAGLLSAPMLLYTIVAFTTDPILAQWNAQNRLPSPHPLHYVLAYGAWLVPAVLGWRVLRRANARLAQFALAWLLLAPVLLYLPIPTQRRLIEGVQLPLAALTVLGLTALAGRAERWALVGMAGLALPTSLLLWAGALAAANRPAEPIFLPAAQAEAFEWLAAEAQPGEVALAAYDTGNALPAYTPLAAYIGHGPETIGLSAKVPRVARFYAAGTPDRERQALLAEGHIRFVLYGPHERTLGGFDPAAASYLQPIYRQGDYAVYAVVP
jgi:hypothetical protein